MLQAFDLRPLFKQPTATFTATILDFPEITPAPLSPLAPAPARDAACGVAIKMEPINPKPAQLQDRQPIAEFFIAGLSVLGAVLPSPCAPVHWLSPGVFACR